MKTLYAILAVVGAIIPYSQLLPWVAQNGVDARGFVLELFSTRIGAFFGLDVIISAIALLAFIAWEGRRARMTKLWMPVTVTLLIGVSCGLPLFLFMRERTIGEQEN
jgi:uncharacterized protein DUF2834